MSEKKKKVAIVGCANSRELAPWGDLDFEFWGVNNAFHSMKPGKYNWTRWFEIHHIDKDEKGTFRRRFDPVFRGQKVDDYISDLAKLNIPVYMQKTWEEVPNGVVYPIEQIVQRFGNYLTNTISFEIALAIMEGFEEIHIYGVDMAVSSKLFLHDEYAQQRPSCEYFIGLAQGLGIKIVIPDTSDLLKTRFMYAYEEPALKAWDKKMADMRNSIEKQRLTALNTKIEAQRKEDQAIGAGLAIDEMNKVWQ